jgi:hypothetical protein
VGEGGEALKGRYIIAPGVARGNGHNDMPKPGKGETINTKTYIFPRKPLILHPDFIMNL